MRKKNHLFYCCFLAVLLVYTGTTFSKEAPQDAGKKQTLNDLQSALEKKYAVYKNAVDLNNLDIYISALALIETSRPLCEKKPASPEAIAAFSACSLQTKAALLQLETQFNKSEMARLLEEINNTLNKLVSVQEQISFLERSRASQLSADLDAEKEKARRLREEADKKFQELQSSLIQVTNDARGTIISMSDILFEVNKANLTPDLKTSLAKIAGILLVFKTSNIIVEGHTDNQGSEDYNQTLSEKRAENVMNFLIEQGVHASRLQAIGYGFSKPIADNDTKEGRQKNRRVDLIVQENKSSDDE